MEIDFKKALVSPFSDKKWYLKVGIGVLLFVPALIAAIMAGGKAGKLHL